MYSTVLTEEIGECANLASFSLGQAEFKLDQAFSNLQQHISKLTEKAPTSKILEVAYHARIYLNAVEYYEHLLALDTAYQKDAAKCMEVRRKQ